MFKKQSRGVPKIFGTVLKIFGTAIHSKKKKKNEKLKKESGVAGRRTHGRGSVPLMSKSDAIPLRHKAETLDKGKTTRYIVTVCSNSNPIYHINS